MNPALGSDFDVDAFKHKMLHSMFDILGLPSTSDSEVTSEKERGFKGNSWNWDQNSIDLEGDWVSNNSP